MKVYEITKIVANRTHKVILKETWHVAFETVTEMNHYMNGKWAMAENNETYVAVEMQG